MRSSRVLPSVCTTLPMTWPRTVAGLIATPASLTTTILCSATRPVPGQLVAGHARHRDRELAEAEAVLRDALDLDPPVAQLEIVSIDLEDLGRRLAHLVANHGGGD